MAVYYNENDPKAAAWLRVLIQENVIPEGLVDERSIHDVRPSDLAGYTQCHFFAGIGGWAEALRIANWGGRPVWTGSCPCQPFSAAGKGLGKDDPRHLWPVWFELIRQCRPVIIFGEQVASKAALSWLDTVQDDMEREVYAFGAVDLCAAGVGVGDSPLAQQAVKILEQHAGRLVLAGDLGGAQEIKDAISWIAGLGMGAPHLRQRLYWVANSPGKRSLPGPFPGIHSGEKIPRPRDGEFERRGSTGIMAEPNSGECIGRPVPAAGDISHRQDSGRTESDSGATGGRSVVRLGNPDLSGPSRLGQHGGGSEGARGVQRGSPITGVMGDTISEGFQEQRRDGRIPRDQVEPFERQGSERAGSPVGSFWSDADWLPCTDRKARPVEPGSFPLAHGVLGRVGLLRGYGNAIIPQVAAEFIQAVKAELLAAN